MLGAFGMKNVYLATYFGRLKRYVGGAYRMYTNYDGSNGKFGNTYVKATSSDDSKLTVYSSLQGNDENKVHIILINRSATAQTANISVSGIQSYTNASVYAMLKTQEEISLLQLQSRIS